MAYKATLKLGGKEYDVMSTSFAFNRDVDAKGRPSSGVYGGSIFVTLESYADTTLVELMLNKQHTAQTGSITFDQGTSDGKMKEVKFTDAFITSYSEAASAHGADAMSIAMTLSAREISVGDNAKLTNLWPDNKA